MEVNRYASESVDWTYITFNVSRPYLELVEGGSDIVGILNTLDDAWGGTGPSAEKDVKFVSQLLKHFGGKAGVATGRGGNKKKRTARVNTKAMTILSCQSSEWLNTLSLSTTQER